MADCLDMRVVSKPNKQCEEMQGFTLGTDKANRFVRSARLLLARTTTTTTSREDAAVAAAAASGSYSSSPQRNDSVLRSPTTGSCDVAKAKTIDAADRQQQQQGGEGGRGVRLSRLLSSPLLANGKRMRPMSRREAERLILGGHVSICGQIITKPHYLLDSSAFLSERTVGGSKATNVAVSVQGKGFFIHENDLKILLRSQNNAGDEDSSLPMGGPTSKRAVATRVWIAHKLSGEIVADADPHGRPSLLQRLMRGGVGRLRNGTRLHLKPIGRLDMTTEGLILVTNDGRYARTMELPESELHRTYRVRVHGPLDDHKIRRIQGGGGGITVDGIRYAPMKVRVDPASRFTSTNKWLEVTCSEGKNRQIRKVFSHLGLNVTRLIRIRYGDYTLDTIPPGLAIEVPVKPIHSQRSRGPLFPHPAARAATATSRRGHNSSTDHHEVAGPSFNVQWTHHR